MADVKISSAPPHLGGEWEALTTRERLEVRDWFIQQDDHERRCCRVHGAHSMPHVGCILR